MAQQSNTWKQFFLSHPENEQGNSNMGAFSIALKAGNSKIEKLSALTEEGTVFVAADSDMQIALFHHPKNLGGTRSRATDKIVSLVGFGSETTCVQINEKIALLDCNTVTPTLDELSACETKEDVKALEIPDQNGMVTFPGSAVFIPCPWLRNFLISSECVDPFELIPAVYAEARKFDDEAEAAGTISAVNHAEDFSLFLYGVGAGSIPETRYKVIPGDGELKEYQKQLHQKFILPPIDNSTPSLIQHSDNSSVLAQLSETMSRQTEEAATANRLRREELDRQKEKDDKKRNKISDLHPSTLNMLTMASSSNCDETPDGPSPSCMKFFNSKNAATAGQELHEMFEDMNQGDVGFAHGTVQALHQGMFLYSEGGTPSNFTIFSFFEQGVLLRDNANKRSLLLFLVSEHGQGQTLDEVKKSAKQEVRIPTDFNGLFNQISYFWGAVKIFMGEDSVLAEALSLFLKGMTKYSHSYKVKIESEKSFPAQILYAIDCRIQRFLVECKRADDRSDVDDRIIDLREITNDVVNNRFYTSLPSAFQVTNPDTNTSSNSSSPKRKAGDDGDEKRKKRRAWIDNDDQHEDFKMLEGEDWKKDYCGRCIDDVPLWEGKTRMCTRWHTKGGCFNDCKKKASHVKKSKIPSKQESEYKDYLRKVRKD